MRNQEAIKTQAFSRTYKLKEQLKSPLIDPSKNQETGLKRISSNSK